jgi:riboflavin kinase/FMN adenylyltransferase
MKIKGIVEEGKEKGREIGFPTINIKIGNKVESGVYAGRVILQDKNYQAGIFINHDEDLLEAHIIGFNGDLYGREIEVEIGKKIREVMKFKNEEELRNQIEKDINLIISGPQHPRK